MTDNEHHILNMPPECDDGSTEYKFRLINLSDKQKQHLASQMTWRLGEEGGQAIYEIGLTDDGFPLGLSDHELNLSLESLREVVDMAENAVICTIDRHTITHHADSLDELVSTILIHRKGDKVSTVESKWKYVNSAKEQGAPPHIRYLAEVIIRKDVGSYWETKCGIAGNVDCGKSTLLGVLTSGKYDNGRGSARLAVMAHEHEIITGRTSSGTQQIVGFDVNGALVNVQMAKRNHGTGKLDWPDIIKNSNKIVTFFDLAGHLKYLPQTLRGLSSNELDYVLIVVGANTSESVGNETNASAPASASASTSNISARGKRNEWINMTKEHLELSLVLGMRCIVVITKIDMVDESIKNKTISGLKKLVKSKFAPYTLDNMDNVKTCVKLMSSGNVIPFVQISNVTGTGHDLLRKLLYYLPPRREYESKFTQPVIMQIQDIFRQVEGTSTIIAGMLTSGEIHAGQAPKGTALKIGPLSDGTFIDARVRSIHCKRVDVANVSAGKYVCLGLPKAVDGSKIKKNMFAVGIGLKPTAIWEFWADIKLNKTESGCIKPNYTPHCYIGHIRQTCKILKIIEIPHDDNLDWENNQKVLAGLAAGSEARVLMRFCFKPELIFDDDKKKLVFKEAKTKGVGSIVKTTDTVHTILDNKTVTKDMKYRPSRKQRKLLREKRNEGLIVPTQAHIKILQEKMII